MPKQYINGIFIREHKFDGGGTILKLSIPADKIDMLASQLKAAASDGWTKLVVTRRREPSVNAASGKVVATHNIAVDDWKPSGGGQPAPAPKPKPAGIAQTAQDDDVPF